MKMLACAASLFCSMIACYAIVLDGTVLLEGRDDHSGVLILFEAVSPSAETDSAESNAGGDYELPLNPGLYNIRYSYPDYEPQLFTDAVLFSDSTLEDIFLDLIGQPGTLFGNLSGTLGPGVYQVSDHLQVGQLDELVILPNTRLEFLGPYHLFVGGVLTAVGTESDSIVFTAADPDIGWDGIYITSIHDDTSEIAYCRIEHASSGGFSGGGISVYESAANIHNCTISHCQSSDYGGGIYVWDSNARIEDCRIHDNSAEFGGGIYAGHQTNLTIINCVLEHNIAWEGGGARLLGSSLEGHMHNCKLGYNEATGGGGLLFSGTTSFTIAGCEFHHNEAEFGGGMWLAGTNLDLTRSAVHQNIATESGGGIEVTGGMPELMNCTLVDNACPVGPELAMVNTNASVRNAILSNSLQSPLYFQFSEDAVLEYNLIWAPGNEPYETLDTNQHAPEYLALLVTTNPGGDSTDTYYNLVQDPLFVDAGIGDFRLLSGSPCIDAGDPNSENDPDGSVADIGAFPFTGTVEIGGSNGAVPAQLLLHQNYPNPFNATTVIPFELRSTARAELTLYDVAGRRVAKLLNDRLGAGEYQVSFDATALASGVYFYELRTQDQRLARRMVLLK